MTTCDEHAADAILYAEDDELVRKLMSKNLRRLGYRLITAVDGQDAIAQFTTYRREIKLLLLDIVMPKVDGMAAFKEIKKMQPEIKVIFCSACPEAIHQVQDSLDSEVAIITKPVNMKLLAGKIREMLGENEMRRLV